jgi:hypothetical protein
MAKDKITCYIVEPSQRRCRAFECDADLALEAMPEAGLKPGHVDFGTVRRDVDTRRGVGIIVYEFGLFDPPGQQSYFVIANRLTAGNAVLFAYDEIGDTVSMAAGELPPITYVNGENEIEAAIQRGQISRPTMSINGQLFWQWPQPAPKDIQKAMNR